jgi:tripartite-type tricarboxylate transporter receptor subunit TctC
MTSSRHSPNRLMTLLSNGFSVSLSRRNCFKTILAATACFLSVGTMAQDYPVKPIRLVVPYSPGAANDALARMVAQRFTVMLGQPVVVENRPGSDGDIGASLVATSKPDGYTILFGFIVNMAQRHHMRSVGYDPLKDFAPVSLVARSYNILAVNPKLPLSSVDELVAFAKAKPGELNIATTGTDLLVELFKRATNVSVTQVPYKGAAPAANSVVAGETQATFGSMVPTLSLVKGGKLRALAITAPNRIDAAPDIPTLTELGVKGVEAGVWFGLFAPAGTPDPIIRKLSGEMIRLGKDPEHIARLAALGQESAAGTPEQLSAHMKLENAKWAQVIKDAGIKLEH